MEVTKKECDMVNGKYIDNTCVVVSDDLPEDVFKGSFNYMTRGKLIKNPRFLFRIKGKYNNEYFGDNNVTKSRLDRVVSLTANLGISKTNEYIIEEKPNVLVYKVDNRIVKRDTFYPYVTYNWNKVGD